MGGGKMGMDKIFVTRSSMPELAEYVTEISGMWENHWLTNMGLSLIHI